MKTRAFFGSRPLLETITRRRSAFGRTRASSEGSSLRTVSAPTMMASTRKRNSFVRSRDALQVIQSESPRSSQILPSSDIASLTVT